MLKITNQRGMKDSLQRTPITFKTHSLILIAITLSLKTLLSRDHLQIQAAVETLETELELLCLTGVEDKLQDDVRQTLERMRNAGVRIWMLTGDKMETATCIAKSSRLVSQLQTIHAFTKVTRKIEAKRELSKYSSKEGAALIIEGTRRVLQS